MGSLKHHVFYEAFKLLTKDILSELESLGSSLQLELTKGRIEWSKGLSTDSKSSRVRFLSQEFLKGLDQGGEKLVELTQSLVHLKWNTDWRTRKNITNRFVETPALASPHGIISDGNLLALSEVFILDCS